MVHCYGAELQCPSGKATPVLILNVTPAGFPWHPCGSYWAWDSLVTPVLPFQAALYHTFVQSITHLFLSVDFLSSELKSSSLQRCPALGSCSTPLVLFPNLPLLFFSRALYTAMRCKGWQLPTWHRRKNDLLCIFFLRIPNTKFDSWAQRWLQSLVYNYLTLRSCFWVAMVRLGQSILFVKLGLFFPQTSFYIY